MKNFYGKDWVLHWAGAGFYAPEPEFEGVYHYYKLDAKDMISASQETKLKGMGTSRYITAVDLILGYPDNEEKKS